MQFVSVKACSWLLEGQSVGGIPDRVAWAFIYLGSQRSSAKTAELRLRIEHNHRSYSRCPCRGDYHPGQRGNVPPSLQGQRTQRTS